jgi:hypothetical protein
VSNQPSYSAIERYARRRMAEGDVFGWSKGRDTDSVVLLVAPTVPSKSFPQKIGRFTVRLRVVEEPEAF